MAPGRPGSGLVSVAELRSVPVVPGCLKFQYAENTGAAFSLFREHPGVLAVAVLAWGLVLPAGERLSRVALGMILGGAVGNLIDRVRFGVVVDFILAYWGRHAWPTFNVADSAICVGVGLFLVASYLVSRSSPGRDSGRERDDPSRERDSG